MTLTGGFFLCRDDRVALQSWGPLESLAEAKLPRQMHNKQNKITLSLKTAFLPFFFQNSLIIIKITVFNGNRVNKKQEDSFAAVVRPGTSGIL